MHRSGTNSTHLIGWSDSLEKRSEIIHAIIHDRSIDNLQKIIDTGWDINEELLGYECEEKDLHSNQQLVPEYRRNALQESVRYTWANGVRALIKAGAGVNLCPGVIDPLTIALCCTPRTAERVEIVKLLLENGGDPNGKADSEEDAPLISAIRESSQKGFNAEFVEILLESGADPNLAKRGYLPVGYQCRCPLSLTVECLVRSLRDLNTRQYRSTAEQTYMKDQRTGLKRANAAIFESLLKFGADTNSNSGLDGPLLHRMVGRFGDFSGGFYELVPEHLDLIYQYGGDVELRDKYLGSALECAVRECGMTQNVRWLLRHGAETSGLQFNILTNQYIPERIRPKRTSLFVPRVLLTQTPLVLLEAGMTIPRTLPYHLSQIKRLIQNFLQKSENDAEEHLLMDIQTQWARITPKEEKLQYKSRDKRNPISQEQRRCQMVDLEEFSDETLCIYPKDEYNPSPGDQWGYSLDMVSKTLEYLTYPRTLQWWCRRCIRESLVSLHPSVVMNLPGPARLKRFVLCHDV